MDRRFLTGFCLGAIVVLGILWAFSAWDNYQKGEQARDVAHDQMMALIDQTQMMRSDMMEMRAELGNLRSRMDANDSKINNLMDLRPMIEDEIAGLKNRLGLQ